MIVISAPQTLEYPGGLDSEQCKEVKDDNGDEYGMLDNMNVDSLEERSKEGDA